MEFCRIFVLSVVFLETSATLARNSTRRILPHLRQQLQQQQQRTLSFGEDGKAAPGVIMIGGNHQQQQLQLEKRNQSKQVREENIRKQLITYLNMSVDQLSPFPSPFIDSHRPEVGRKKVTGGGGGGDKNPRRNNLSRGEDRKHKIIAYGEKVSNVSDNRVVQFSLRDAAWKRAAATDSILSVTEATVSVLFRRNKPASRRMGAPAGGALAGGSSALQAKGNQHRDTINVYVLSVSKSSAVDGDNGANRSVPVAYLSVAPQQTRWLKLLLPTSVAQAAIESPDKLLRLRIACDNCQDGDDIVTFDEPPPSTFPIPLRRPIPRSPFHLTKGDQTGDDRKQDQRHLPTAPGYLPYLVVHTRVKPRPVTMTTATDGSAMTTRRSSCRKIRGC